MDLNLSDLELMDLKLDQPEKFKKNKIKTTVSDGQLGRAQIRLRRAYMRQLKLYSIFDSPKGLIETTKGLIRA